ncbi:MAG: hypothetical protein JRH09_02675 [Deltaproteobacteria bacterium]|nr:hypothetical protein [Deltaproteobacteria bacterium]
MKNILAQGTRKKLIISLIVVCIGIMSSTAALDALLKMTYVKKIDDRGSQYFSETLKRAVYAFAIARAINGVISVVQDTKLAVTPAGFGVALGVGEILDPINDLIERFSWIMLVSTTSLGIQTIFMEVGIWFGFKILLTFSMLVCLIGIWVPRFSRVNFMSLGYKMVLVSIVIRFCIPAVAVISDEVYDLFLKDKYLKSTESLEEIKREIKNPNLLEQDTENRPGESGFWDELNRMYEDAKETANIRHRLALLKDAVSHCVTYIINLIIVFVLQTIVIPVLVLWGLMRFTGYLLGTNISNALEQRLKAITIKS